MTLGEAIMKAAALQPGEEEKKGLTGTEKYSAKKTKEGERKAAPAMKQQ